MFERDYNYFGGLMEEVYWGVEAELEEEAYQFRRARLNDRGFPDFFEAQSVFAYLKPEQFLTIRAGYESPSREDLPDDEEVIAPEMAPASRRRRLAVQHRADGGIRGARANGSSAARWRW